ncbi:MAG TPA: hypothetical protein VFJ94_04055 [Intrasporangium sp.]|uniref:hypothetical protein n=1 Tax=Intrasporangium sp. TaxID=1925024 RepID=UPI002D76D12A|nr:hypothetical protein [Intrasporangium sp.]HET7397677.1 hypothetical protein [Intrasporangium sp.]
MLRVSRSASFVAGALIGLSTLATTTASADDGGGESPLLRSSVGASMPDDHDLFMVQPGSLPWVIEEGDVRLDGDGSLRVEVEGLIVPTLHKNPVPMLAASVACNGAVVATTKAVPFSMAGDARIRAHVMLPMRCLAPAVLLNPAKSDGTVNAGFFIGASGR